MSELSELVNKVHCCDAIELMRLLPDASVDLIVTDPPYGVGKPSAWRPETQRFNEIANNDTVLTGWIGECFRTLSPAGAVYSFANWQNVDQWKSAFVGHGFHIRNIIVWDKVVHGLADIATCYAPQYELIIFAVKGRHVLRGKRPHDVIRCPRVSSSELIHPYEKPISLLKQLIQVSSNEGDLVCDPFSGSGTTALAARNLERNFIACDTTQEYVDVAIKRLGMPYTPMFKEMMG